MLRRADLCLPGERRVCDDQAAAVNGWLDGERTMMEALIGFRRAGCDGILTYAALEVARWLRR